MKLKGLFWGLTGLLLLALAILSYKVLYLSSVKLFFIVEALVFIIVIYLVVFYRRLIKPLHTIGSGMELLREQDFSSRLGHVGQYEADKVVEVFNKMMEQLKNERLLLREQNHFLDLLINASPMGVLILDLDGKVQSLNRSMLRMLNLQSESSLMGKTLGDVEPHLLMEMGKISLYESATIRLNDANIYKCTHSSFIDQGFHHSFYLVESLTQEVFKAEKKAYEKVIRMISHEVNNTTAGIISTLDTLQEAFAGTEQMEDVCEVLRVSIERCYRMSNFITKFADVVRIPKPQLCLQDLNSLVVSSKNFMESICVNRNVRITLELSEEPVFVNLDEILFEQVLINIIKNAVESIEKDGEIVIRTITNPNTLEISDNGKGIDKDTETKLFSPFFSTKPDGQGIGLVFIREVLQQHNCTFSLRSYPDGLTRFRIMFKR